MIDWTLRILPRPFLLTTIVLKKIFPGLFPVSLSNDYRLTVIHKVGIAQADGERVRASDLWMLQEKIKKLTEENSMQQMAFEFRHEQQHRAFQIQHEKLIQATLRITH